MLSALVCLVAVQVPIQQPPRLRTVLPNGAVVLVEKIPGASALAVDLFISARHAPETPLTHGYRHLLEHFCARGDGTLDRQLETAGAFLTAHTTRDFTEFDITVPRNGLKLGLQAVRQVMLAPELTQERITKEANIIEQELALQDSDTGVSGAAWRQAYGDAGLDPLGNIDVMRLATPEALAKTHRKMMRADDLAIVIAGDVDLDEGTRAATGVLKAVPAGDSSPVKARPDGLGGTVYADVAGSARAASVRGYRDPVTAWTIAAGFALATSLPNASFIYTPSAQNGLVVVGTNDRQAEISKVIDSTDIGELYNLGLMLSRRWVQSKLADPVSAASFRGELLVQSPSLRPETLLENLDAITLADFKRGLERYRSPAAVFVGGNP